MEELKSTTFKAIQAEISEMNREKGWTQDLLSPMEPGEDSPVDMALAGIAMIHLEHSLVLEEIRKTALIPGHPKLIDPVPGVWEEPRPKFGLFKTLSKLALIHSEVTEAVQAALDGKIQLWHSGEKPEGVAAELADVVIRVLHLADMLGIDLEAAIRVKLDYNAKRAHRHGGKHA